MNDNVIGLVLEEGQSVSHESLKNRFYVVFKRLFDIIFSTFVLILLLPIFIIIGICVKIDSRGKIFYKHKRLGKNGEYIYLYKFRSMYTDSKERLEKMLKDEKIRKEWEENFKLDNDPRITRVGKILRKTSLDELPQLLNIIKGDMSLIGPRPVIDDEIDKYGLYRNRFLSVTPGLTGWWACNGRSCTSYDERIELELYYVNHRGFKLDIKCFFKTFIDIFKARGAK